MTLRRAIVERRIVEHRAFDDPPLHLAEPHGTAGFSSFGATSLINSSSNRLEQSRVVHPVVSEDEGSECPAAGPIDLGLQFLANRLRADHQPPILGKVVEARLVEGDLVAGQPIRLEYAHPLVLR